MARRLIYYFAISLILITPFIYSLNLYNGLVTAKQIWFYGAIGLFLFVFSIDFLFWKRRVKFDLNKIDISLLVFYVYFFIRTASTPYMPVLHNEKFLNWTLLIIMYFVIRIVIVSFNSNSEKDPDLQVDEENSSDFATHFEKNKITFFIILFLIVTGLVEAIWGLLQLYGYTQSFNSNFKITGSFFNPAPYALYLAAVFPLALGVLLSAKEMIEGESTKDLKQSSLTPSFSRVIKLIQAGTLSFILNKLVFYLSFCTVFSILIVLPATMIRASLLGLLAGSLIVVNYRYHLVRKIKAFLNNPFRKLIALGVIILLITASALGLFYLKKGSSNGRLLIWEVTLGKISQKPLFGYGVGRFEAEYNNWQAEFFRSNPEYKDDWKGRVAGNTKYCFNEYLEMASETGVIGLALLLAVITSLFCSSLPFRHNQTINRLQYSSLCLISLFICALVSIPFYSLPTLILLFTILAHISAYQTPVVVIRLPAMRMLFRVTMSVVLLNFCIFLLGFMKKQYQSYYIIDEADMLYQLSNYDASCESFSEIFDNMKYNGQYQQYYAKALLMQRKYEESIMMYERAKHYTSDELLYCSFGNAYKALKLYYDAENAYINASFMVPHKLYPLYLLATLYDETNQGKKAVAIAKEVLSKNVKIQSKATEEIIEAMQRIIARYEE